MQQHPNDEFSVGIVAPELCEKFLLWVSPGTPVQVSCEASELVVTETAVRTIFTCNQNLAALMRFPCPGDSRGSCAVDYEGQW
jgi:hypothetical protein